MSSNSLLDLLASHAMQIAVLAVLIWIINRAIAKDRPHVAHALWALVLLKCFTPPILPSPTSPFSWIATAKQTTAHKRQSASVAPSDPSQSGYRVYYSEAASPVAFRQPATIPVLPETTVDAKSTFGPWLVILWISGTAGVSAWISFRVVRFMLLIRRRSCPVPPEVASATKDLQKRLGIRRPVRIRVLDALIGPAVMGIFRPTLLLPRVIVEGSSAQAIAPLIAHELVHIRRGDLLWSAAQTLSSLLWWFHPGVWVANRMMTRESERSCDEETVMSLRIRPADYARSLISVLETKQQLAAVPIVPGLRPVDITSNRMERIMRIGQGSHSRTPRLAFATLIVGALIALPGAAWLTAQETEQESGNESPQNETKQKSPPKNPVQPAQPAPPMLAPTNSDLEDSLLIEAVIMDIPTAKAQSLPVEGRSSQSSAPNTISGLAKGEPFRLASSVKSDLGFSGQLLLKEGGPEPQAAPLNVLAVAANPTGPWVLSEEAMTMVSQWQRSPEDSGARTINRPTIMTLNGQAASVHIGSEVPYVSKVDPETGETTSTNLQIGLNMEVTATLCDQGKKVQFACSFRETELTDIQAVAIPLSDGTNKTNIPSVKTTSFDSSLVIPVGKPFAFTSGSIKEGEKEFVKLLVFRVSRPKAQVSSIANTEDRIGEPKAEQTSETKTPQKFDKKKAQARTTRHARQRYERISIMGRTTTAADIQLDPPSDDLCMQAIEKSVSAKSDGRILGPGKHRIIKEKIADYLDPVRFVPLIGNAQLHHAHYKCTIYSEHDQHVVTNVFYIDHNHFVMVGGEIPEDNTTPTEDETSQNDEAPVDNEVELDRLNTETAYSSAIREQYDVPLERFPIVRRKAIRGLLDTTPQSDFDLEVKGKVLSSTFWELHPEVIEELGDQLEK